MEKLPLSVFIIAKNEQERLPMAIKSVVGWVDEIIVIEDGSVDDTVKIAYKCGAKVIHNKWKGYGQQKRFGEEKCKNTWLLNIDADEEVSDDLKQEIIQLFDNENKPAMDGYYIKIKNIFWFENRPKRLATTEFPIRLYNKQKGRYRDSSVHDRVCIKSDRLGKLRGYLVHRCFTSYEQWLDKINFYSSVQAENMVAKGRKVSNLRILIEPIFGPCK